MSDIDLNARACAWCDNPAKVRTAANWPACQTHADEDARLRDAVAKSAARLAEAEAEARAAADPIIRYVELIDGRTVFDEFVAHDVATVHFEAMGEAHFWIGVTLKDGRSWAINCGAISTRVKGYANCEED